MNPPTFRVPSGLSGTQVKRLCELLSLSMDLDELRMLVREALNDKLHVLVDINKPYAVVVFDLVEKLEQASRVAALVLYLGRTRPDLIAKLQEVFGERDRPAVTGQDREGLKQFGLAFNTRKKWLDHLNAYKELHDTLHELSEYIPQLRLEAAARLAGEAIPESTIDSLMQWADDTERFATETEFPHSPPISIWVPRLARDKADFLSDDPALHKGALKRLCNLPDQQLHDLNRRLVDCARRLEAEVLIELLDKLPLAAFGLAAATASFRDPCIRLAKLIRAHDLCQQIDVELRGALGLPAITPDEITNWADVQQWFAELQEVRTGDIKVTETIKAVNRFEAVPTVDAFHELLARFKDLFKRTDERLLQVTNSLAREAGNLAQALEQAP